MRFARGSLIVAGLLLASARSAAQTPWAETVALGPLVCHSQFPLAAHAETFARLGELQQEICQRFDLPPASEPIYVFLLDSRKSYQDFVAARHPELITRKAGYVKNRGPGEVVAYRSSTFEVDLRHECTHALLHAVLPRVPLWLDEGIAEYFELPPERRHANSHRQAIVWQTRLGMSLPLEQLESLVSMAEMGRNEYRWSWAWTSFLLEGPPEARSELAAYVRSLREGRPAELADSLAVALVEPERQLSAFFKYTVSPGEAIPASYQGHLGQVPNFSPERVESALEARR